MVAFSELLNSLTIEQVDYWWINIASDKCLFRPSYTTNSGY